MSTLTDTQESAIREWLAAHPTLSTGIGTAESACSVAAINLALSGALTDNIPDCMSRVIGQWVIGVQDAMPSEIRNSAAWRDLLPLAAGTGRSHEAERMAMVLDWMWGTALPMVQPLADAHGFGEAWQKMTTLRTRESAHAANAAAAAHAYAYYAADAAADAAHAAADTADAYAAYASYVADAANVAAHVAADAAYYAASAAGDAANAAAYVADEESWQTLDPVALLRRLVAVTDIRALEEDA